MKLKNVDHAAVKTLKERWLTQLDLIIEATGATYLSSDFERTFDWCDKHCEDGADKHLYILETNNGEPRAVAEIINASKSKDPSFKFLNIYLEPNLNTDWRETLDSKTMIDIAGVIAAVIAEAAKLASQNGTNKLKIYGRTDEMNGIFDALLSLTGKDAPAGLSLYKQSKWLVIKMENGL
ncbi:MAG: hypothetical protein L3J62_10215 [Gammaproteobacteria bacterium]|nr:hypothetical protein [Gammaproteobacteria bacterium]